MKNKSIFLIIAIIIALSGYLFYDYMKYNKEIPGRVIFSDSLEIDSISLLKDNEALPEIELTETQSKEILENLQKIHYINKRDSNTSSKSRYYTLSAKYGETIYLISLSDKYNLEFHESHPNDKSNIYIMNEEESQELFNLLNRLFE
ncbi:hypothetical protein [Helcococcus sueciensis]|uniref:hypothetical protein n=1 Tax=Helcococcus sueciensis TaxID=241555 RepID=UPI0004023F18|nr:hypothetical protein [Helcococcus sueciensis]